MIGGIEGKVFSMIINPSITLFCLQYFFRSLLSLSVVKNLLMANLPQLFYCSVAIYHVQTHILFDEIPENQFQR